MKKLREISEEQFLVLASVGADACWDMSPLYTDHDLLMTHNMRASALWRSVQAFLNNKRVAVTSEFKFYALVEVDDSNEETQEDYA